MLRYTKGPAFRELELDEATLVIRSGGDGDQPTTLTLRLAGPVEARWEHDKRVALLIAEGFKRALAPAPAPLEEHPALIEAIGSDPEREETYLVYADWLQRRSDPRGELICVQHAIAEHRRRAKTQKERFFSDHAQALDRAEALLLLLHRERIFGAELARVISVEQQRYLCDLFELEWQMGFVRRASLPRSARRQGLDVAPWQALLGGELGRWIREIALDWADCDQLGEAPLAWLERLEVVLDSWWPPEREAETHEADRGYRSLDELFPPETCARAILAALAPLLHEPPPRLARLVLQRCRFGPALLQPVVDSPLGRQLSQLDLSHGTLSDGELPWLLAELPALDHLERLDLRRNRFSAEGRRQLAGLGEHVVVK